MERTPEFIEAILKARSDSQQEAVPDRICLSSSPYVLRASELVRKLSPANIFIF
jgi:predicted Ser/Thr protein kinase